jgi:hypothetical protein
VRRKNSFLLLPEVEEARKFFFSKNQILATLRIGEYLFYADFGRVEVH